MKFGKELTSQTVPEWEEAYMNYNYFKTLLKEILISRRPSQNQSSQPHYNYSPRQGKFLKRRSFYRDFSGLTNRHGNHSTKGDEDEAILVGEMQQEERPEPEGQSYQTLFLRPSEEGAENELVFFRRLDDELKKVIDFYRGKVEEVLKEAEELTKQMDALVALQLKINDPHFHSSSPASNSGSSPLKEIHELEEKSGRDQTNTTTK